MFIFVELFCVGEKIGFEVLDFGPAGPDTEPGQHTFSVFWFSEFSFKVARTSFQVFDSS